MCVCAAWLLVHQVQKKLLMHSERKTVFLWLGERSKAAKDGLMRFFEWILAHFTSSMIGLYNL